METLVRPSVRTHGSFTKPSHGRKEMLLESESVPFLLMAASPLQLDSGLTCPALTAGGYPGALSYPAGKVFCRRSPAGSGEQGMPPVELQESSWQEFFGGPTQWWDNSTPQSLDFRHKNSNVPLWLNNGHKPACVHSELAAWDAGMKTPPESVSPRAVEGQGVIERSGEGLVGIAICRKHCEDGRISDAVDALNLLVQQGCYVHNNVFYRVLKVCIERKDLVMGRRIHALTMKSGHEGDAFLATHLIGLYASHGSLEEAMRIFAMVSVPTIYTWTTIISAYARHGEAAQAVRLYRQMVESSTVEPNNRLYVAVLKACATAGDLVAGQEVHARILAIPGKPNIFVQVGLVSMYAKCGSLGDARRVFDRLPERDVVAWNAMLAGYAQQGMGEEALSLYSGMQQEGLTPPNSVTYVCLLQACASVGIGALDQGKQLHAQILKRRLRLDLVLSGSLVNMYAKCGSLGDARRVFDRLAERSVAAWNAMLAGYAQQGMGEEALGLYRSMQQEGITTPDPVTYVCLLQACAGVGMGALGEGKQLHAQIEERGLQKDLVLGGSLVNMYAKCGSLGDARRVFDRLPDKNLVAWNALLAGYAQQGMGEEALRLYTSLQQDGISTPNSVTYVCLLRACAFVAALPLGKHLHAQIEEQRLQADLLVGTALVNMYAKCGSMYDSQQLFDSLPERSIEAWGALIGGYTRQGDSEVVFDLVDRRMRLEGIEPDGITFLCVLTVCSHVGEVDRGRKYFEAMQSDYGISPTIEHYTCMVDLLGRAGHLDEALHMAKTMPLPPASTVWHTLLGACRKWKNVEIGLQAFEFAVSLDGEDASSYVLMSNIYASAQMWEEAQEMQARRKKSGAWKKPGQSWWTDMGGVVHTFVAGDKMHPETDGIYARLEQLVPQNEGGRGLRAAASYQTMRRKLSCVGAE